MRIAETKVNANPSKCRHGLSDTRIHRCWMSMRGRCERPTDGAYMNYGGRGITVCERWQKFENFLEDMGAMPDGSTIERIDVNKGYEPSNCKWATRAEQSKNTRRNLMYDYNGKTMCLKDWAREVGIPYPTLYRRISIKKIPFVDAIKSPVLTPSEAASVGGNAKWANKRHELLALAQ